MLQCRQIPMYAADDRVAGIVALGKCEQLAHVNEAHVDRMSAQASAAQKTWN